MPCVLEGWAAPSDTWCAGCRLFTAISDHVQIRRDNEELERAKEQR